MNPRTRQNILKALHVIAISVTIAAGLLTVLSGYGGVINPSVTCVGAVLAMMFPAFLFVNVIIGIVNLFWNRRLAIVSGVSLLLAWSPLLTYCPLNFFRPSLKEIAAMKEPTLKVMTFNVLAFSDYRTGGWHEPNGTVSYILDQDADVVLLQEAYGLFDSVHDNGITAEQRNSIYELYPYSYMADDGMCMLSKYPAYEVFPGHDSSDGMELHTYNVSVGDKSLTLINVHLQSIGLTRDDKRLYTEITEGEAGVKRVGTFRHTVLQKLGDAFRARALQARKVRLELDAIDGTVILAGDFNDIPGSYASRTIAGHDMTDAYREAGLGPAVTYHADRMYFRIDQMFYRGDIEALRTWVGDCQQSDHYPMMCYFSL